MIFNLKRLCLFFLTLQSAFCFSNSQTKFGEKPFAILITSYNNEKYARENILSAINQHYSNYQIIFVNDCSSDNTLEIVKQTISDYNAFDKVTIIDNKTRKLGLKNYYEAIINYTNDEEIILNLDGDDFLANPRILALLNKAYQSPNQEVWLTYGQFLAMSNKSKGWNVQVPKGVIDQRSFRKFDRTPTHLRTFYSWLFKRIKKEDLLYNGNFFEMTWDCAFMYPMLEMCGNRFKFIDKITYLYNDTNPINDHKVNVELQRFYYDYIRAMPKYKKLKHDIFHRCNALDCILCNEKIKESIHENS